MFSAATEKITMPHLLFENDQKSEKLLDTGKIGVKLKDHSKTFDIGKMHVVFIN